MDKRNATHSQRQVELSESLVARLGEVAALYGSNQSEAVEYLVRWALDRIEARPAIVKGRGQRSEAKSDRRLDWWRDAKFGMFIHWGLYAIPAGVWKGQAIPGIGEWIMHRARIPVAEYERLTEDFNPVEFDAQAWVSLAKAAGQKYIVITAKHHDGFCLFDSQVTDYTIVQATPFGRDPLAELAEACQREGIRLGFYYSQSQDWHHPDGLGNDWDYNPGEKDFAAYLEDYVKPQVRELLTHYGPVGLIWFDTPRSITEAQSKSLLDLVHTLQPDCLVSGRVGNEVGDYASAGDNRIPDEAIDADWETPATINDTWGFKENDEKWKSAETLILKLVDIVSKGGNYLLNVGPTAEGVIPQPSAERLLGVGEWLELHGESIYGTQPGPIQGLAWCRSTTRPGTLYLHVIDWPEDGRLIVPDAGLALTEARLLAKPEHTLPFERVGGQLVLQGPGEAPADPVTVIALALE